MQSTKSAYLHSGVTDIFLWRRWCGSGVGEVGFISSLEAAGGAPEIRHKLKTFPLLHSSRCCQPVSEEQHAGQDFGYVVAFRPLGGATWIQAAVASPDASRYVYRNHSVAPLTLFEVKVGVYNSRGEGPFSRAVRVFSAEEGEQKTLTGLLTSSGAS